MNMMNVRMTMMMTMMMSDDQMMTVMMTVMMTMISERFTMNDEWRCEGGWKTYQTKGVQKTLLGGVSFVRFPPPSFHPPMGSSDYTCLRASWCVSKQILR